MKLSTIFLKAALFLSVIGFSQNISVSNVAEFEAALANANAGETISVESGTYTNANLNIDVNATAANPVIIQAATPGAVFLEGNSRIEISGAYIDFIGFVFQNPSNLAEGLTAADNVDDAPEIDPVIRLRGCDHCLVQNVKIDTYNVSPNAAGLDYATDDFSVYSKFKWLLLDGQYNEISYCSFIGKNGKGSIINDNRNAASNSALEEEDFLKIHHNYFADRVPVLGTVADGENDQDAIRIGNSATSLSDSSSEVHDNYFYSFFGEIEMISNKSGNNKYYNNTFRDYAGTLTLRHGDGCEVYGNFFFAENNPFSGGIRVIGEDHLVYNNYIQDVNHRKENGSNSNATGGINVSNGIPDSDLNRYFQVINTQIVNNTLVNCSLGMRIGSTFSSEQSLAPSNLRVADNIIYNSSEEAYQVINAPIDGSVSEGNLENLTASDIALENGIYRLQSGSNAIGVALGTYDFVSVDAFDGARSASFDVGAEEFNASGSRMPYTNEDVGVTVGFITGPTLAVSPSTLGTGKNAQSLTFQIISNVDWSISETTDWLTLSTTSGNGNAIITATLAENTTGAERSAVISIEEVGGTSNLTAEVEVTQSDIFTPTEIEIVGATAVGTELEDDGSIVNGPANAYNNDTSNYWTGNAEENEVAITFDLECEHELTEIGINFWRADERTTTFSIAISNNENGPFVEVLTGVESAMTGATVNTEQIFDLNGNIARFVRIIGLGNSAGSGWSSIANVNIYGNTACAENTLSIITEELSSKGISVFPNPVTSGADLQVTSPKFDLTGGSIYNMAGQKVLDINGAAGNEVSITTTSLTSGVYFMVLTDLGVSKFIVK